MRKKLFIIVVCFLVFIGFFLLTNFASAQKKPAEPMMLILEGAKLPPVPFSHTSHAEKEKIECVVCHHKDKDAKEPQACGTCHLLKEVKDNAAPAKDAFHKNCQTCHKENVAKGKVAPVKCNECHKK
jgi:hypothetical protein